MTHLCHITGWKAIVYVVKQGQRNLLFLRAMDQSEAKPVAGTDGAEMPFFSPDGRYVGFFVFPDNQLKKIPVSGGSPMRPRLGISPGSHSLTSLRSVHTMKESKTLLLSNFS